MTAEDVAVERDAGRTEVGMIEDVRENSDESGFVVKPPVTEECS